MTSSESGPKPDPRESRTPAAPSGSGRSIGTPDTWVDAHGDALFRFAISRVGDRATAEDLVQETLLAALKGTDGFRGDSEFRTWLVGVLRHKIIDHARRSGREGPLDSASGEDSLIDGWFGPNGRWVRPPGKWDVDPARLVLQREFWIVAARCAQGVPGRAGEAFSLRVMCEMEPQDVCKVLEITPTNLWVLLHRARARMRACLEVNWFGASVAEPRR